MQIRAKNFIHPRRPKGGQKNECELLTKDIPGQEWQLRSIDPVNSQRMLRLSLDLNPELALADMTNRKLDGHVTTALLILLIGFAQPRANAQSILVSPSLGPSSEITATKTSETLRGTRIYELEYRFDGVQIRNQVAIDCTRQIVSPVRAKRGNEAWIRFNEKWNSFNASADDGRRMMEAICRALP